MISINKVTKNFGDRVLFKELSFTISSGEMVALIGKSGSGKTTLLNMIGLIDFDYDGAIYMNEVEVKMLKNSKRSAFIRENINYLFQNYALVEDEKVSTNLQYALHYTNLTKTQKQDMIEKCLQKVGLGGFADKKIYTLSGGEQQRVALARVLLKPGNIILADEPTGNLDTDNRDVVLNMLEKLNEQGKTVIIVTHDDYVANRCKKIIDVS
ncbi:putative bacteriocin export ABC transporter [Enterococcus diestrammenae]|uniref:putative bacteriocin export ABC transporter n=1 Tax=Enterococcus diestrammenae TaxID=1155073 RepID=UPI0022E5B1CB|nr:putative bacteriocin export ABC transporter [Enterococcus diestrammenae]